MIISVTINMFLRPSLSPKWPNISPPSGRVTKPTANVVYASNVDTTGSLPGKYSLLKTMPATTPYRKKSYHSIVAPTTAEITTLRMALSLTCAASISSPPLKSLECLVEHYLGVRAKTIGASVGTALEFLNSESPSSVLRRICSLRMERSGSQRRGCRLDFAFTIKRPP